MNFPFIKIGLLTQLELVVDFDVIATLDLPPLGFFLLFCVCLTTQFFRLHFSPASMGAPFNAAVYRIINLTNEM